MSVSDRMAIALAAAVLCTAPALAETPMTAEEFDAFSLGKTLDYSIDGQLYGSEMHLPGHRTRDADVGKACHDGTWFAEGDQICFMYGADPKHYCWRFWRQGDGLLAQPSGSPDATPSDVTIATTSLTCPGPEVGV